jgi:dTDP-4-dehydrorhamnose reductase
MPANHQSKPVAWITGAGGLIGSALSRVPAPEKARWIIRALSRKELELTDWSMVRSQFAQDQPELVIHCAALSQSPACEAEPDKARQLNVEVTAFLADLATNAAFYFLSTDLVFDGRAGNYDESAAVNPLSVYAETKVAAEQLVRVNPGHTIIRTSLNGGVSPSGNRAFNEQLRLSWAAGKTVDLFVDEFRSPIAAEVTARALWELAGKNCRGLYHLAGAERLSRWQIGQLIASRWTELSPKLSPTSIGNYAGPPRPPDSSLNSAKAQRLLSFELPRFSEWLSRQPPGSF